MTREEEIPLPSRSEIIRKDEEPRKRDYHSIGKNPASHIPVVEKPAKTFSIREVIADNKDLAPPVSSLVQEPESEAISKGAARSELTAEAFTVAWKGFH